MGVESRSGGFGLEKDRRRTGRSEGCSLESGGDQQEQGFRMELGRGGQEQFGKQMGALRTGIARRLRSLRYLTTLREA
ncbi:hypothetical protein KFK09_001778 [Dendrobium nobile]|uniref:Uncharacterized protein n=1 Tax=Dendrobium nobile TaxID=94219 RepID=A0A8T3CB93_DENNO|nr:hypothetical protein KFK09_001778 [Dendrobium nobile]